MFKKFYQFDLISLFQILKLKKELQELKLYL